MNNVIGRGYILNDLVYPDSNSVHLDGVARLSVHNQIGKVSQQDARDTEKYYVVVFRYSCFFADGDSCFL